MAQNEENNPHANFGMKEETIREKIFLIISEHYEIDEDDVTIDSVLLEIGDDLDFTEFIMALEEEFQIEITPESEENIVTVKDAIETVHFILWSEDYKAFYNL